MKGKRRRRRRRLYTCAFDCLCSYINTLERLVFRSSSFPRHRRLGLSSFIFFWPMDRLIIQNALNTAE